MILIHMLQWLPTSPPTRAPPLGPSNPFGKISLLLVNQSHTVQIVHRQSSSFSFQLVSASLRHASQTKLGDRPFMGETNNSVGGLSVCVKAAIGLAYNGAIRRIHRYLIWVELIVFRIIHHHCNLVQGPSTHTYDFRFTSRPFC